MGRCTSSPGNNSDAKYGSDAPALVVDLGRHDRAGEDDTDVRFDLSLHGRVDTDESTETRKVAAAD